MIERDRIILEMSPAELELYSAIGGKIPVKRLAAVVAGYEELDRELTYFPPEQGKERAA